VHFEGWVFVKDALIWVEVVGEIEIAGRQCEVCVCSSGSRKRNKPDFVV
jgi:hypothetical protein